MRRIAPMFVFAALLIAGCAPMQWTRQDASAEQLNRDLKDCQDSAFWEAQRRPFGFQHIGPMVVQDSAGRRLFVYPHGPFADPYGERFMDEGRIVHFCMGNRGYQLVPVPKKS